MSKHLIVTFMIVAQTDNATMDLTVHLEMTSSLAHNFHIVLIIPSCRAAKYRTQSIAGSEELFP